MQKNGPRIRQRQFRILGWTVPDAVGNGTVKLFRAELSSFVVGTVVVLGRNCRLLCPKAFFVLFVRVCVVARVLRLSCCAFRFSSRWVLHELSVCDAIYLSRTVNIDSLFLRILFLIFFVFTFFFFRVFFVFLPTSITFVCCCLLASLLQFAYAISFLSSRCCFLFLEFCFPVHFLAIKSASDVYLSLTPLLLLLLLWDEDCYFRDVTFV